MQFKASSFYVEACTPQQGKVPHFQEMAQQHMQSPRVSQGNVCSVTGSFTLQFRIDKVDQIDALLLDLRKCPVLFSHDFKIVVSDVHGCEDGHVQ